MSKELQERGEKFYQYTAIDEYSRLRYTWFTNAHDTYASSEFVKRMVRYFPFKVKTIQTDNGFEFTNRLSWQAFLKSKKTMFEKTLEAREKNRNRNRNKMRNLRNSMAIGKAYNKLFFLYIGRNRKMSI